MTRRRESVQDELLVVRCQLGEPDAIDELVDGWNGRLWSYLRRLSPDHETAQEALQETWLRVLRGLPRLRNTERFAAWMYRIARNVVVDRLRAVSAEPKADDPDPDHTPSSRPMASVDVDHRELHRKLASLPLIERDVLTLFYVQDLSLTEVAEILEIPVGTVKSRLFRARGLLRRKFEPLAEGVA